MSLLFTVPYNGVTIHVLQIRNRTALLASELGMAAGYSDEGQGFLDLIVREWAPSLEEDDDVAQVVGAELDAIKREVPLPENTTMALVLFATGAERVLLRSHARFSRPLIRFLHTEVLARIVTLHRDEKDDGNQGGAPASPTPPVAPLPSGRPPSIKQLTAATAQWQGLLAAFAALADTQREAADFAERLQRRVLSFEAVHKLASELRGLSLIDNDVYGSLRIEAVEELLGRPLRTNIPPFTDAAANQPFAA